MTRAIAGKNLSCASAPVLRQLWNRRKPANQRREREPVRQFLFFPTDPAIFFNPTLGNDLQVWCSFR